MPRRTLKEIGQMPRRLYDEPEPFTTLPLEGASEDPIDERVRVEPTPFGLPSGHHVDCQGDAEQQLCRLTAQPYLDAQDAFPPDVWVHVKHFLEAVLMRDRLMRRLNSLEGEQATAQKQREMRQLLALLTGQIEEYTKKLDPLRQARGDEGQSPAEWRKWVMEKAIAYAEGHLGEFTWLATCPEPDCRYHDEPFPMLMETPHFAFDAAAGRGVVWNDEVLNLVHRHYCRLDPDLGCDHPAHMAHFDGSLSVRDAARILRVSPIGILAICYERGFALGVEFDLDRPESLARYVDAPR
jgi:hypothetical protein